MYIISQENPADILTKYKPGDLETDLWKKGPRILNEPSRWQEFIPGPSKVDEVPLVVGQLVVNPNVHSNEFLYISNCTSLEQVFKETASHRSLIYNTVNKLSIRLVWFKVVQDKYYKDIISF